MAKINSHHQATQESRKFNVRMQFISLISQISQSYNSSVPVPVAARSKAWVCGRSPAEIVGSNPTGGHGCLSVVSVVCCQVEVSVKS